MVRGAVNTQSRACRRATCVSSVHVPHPSGSSFCTSRSCLSSKRKAVLEFLIIHPFFIPSLINFLFSFSLLPQVPCPSFPLSFPSCSGRFYQCPGVEVRRLLSSNRWFVILADPKRKGTHGALGPQGCAPGGSGRGDTGVGAFIAVSSGRTREGG